METWYNKIMTNPSDRVETYITKNSPKWIKRMGLSHWDIEQVFINAYFGDDNGEDFKVTATTETRWQYMQAVIKWYLPSAVRHDNETLEKVLVHELCHVLLAPEQALIDTEIIHSANRGRYDGNQHDALTERNYEHLELSTELVTRAILNGWNR